MIKASIVFFILVVLCIGSWWVFFNNISAAYEADKQKMSIALGEQVILDGDTLSIVDYSVMDATYTLSNGKTIAYELGVKLTGKHD